ncbi:glycosyltransferase [Tropicimonas aquimaris]|uniref:Glycosyltransferase n=1 Tax=Tropicimonas aquimaris TaxID=914152 RepID=A0ABW3IQD9_9RHOB
MNKPEPVIVTGFISEYPYGGVAWQTLHYIEGLRRSGFDPYYFEETGTWPADPKHGLAFLSDVMEAHGLEHRWICRSSALGKTIGLSEPAFADVLTSTSALFNVTGSTLLGEEFLAVPIRLHIETDPVEFQLKRAIELAGAVSQDDERYFEYRANIDLHTHLFTFGENFGATDCDVPNVDYRFIPTRQPVVVDWWAGSPPSDGGSFTTIANWDQRGEKDVVWQGEEMSWTKGREFLRFIGVPESTGETFELALSSAPEDVRDRLAAAGWTVSDAVAASRTPDVYRNYIQRSRGEFTVAKYQYHRLRCGWFSDRSACYLAAGRPVVTQDTGFGNILPVGEGLFPFSTVEDVCEATEAIATDPERHQTAALEIAREYFDAEKVVGDMLREVGLL